MRHLIVVCALILFVQYMTPKVFADCQPIYGGGTTCQPVAISVSKMIFNPQTSTYVHDLGANDVQFRPGDTITFQITVTNTGVATIAPITVNDILPNVLTFVQGQGTFTASSNTLAMTIPTLSPGQSQTFTIMTQVLGPNQFPSNVDTQCFTNLASVMFNNSSTTQDTSQFCIFHPLTASPAPTTTVPPTTGPNSWALLSLLPAGTIGLVVLKLARKEHSYGRS